MLYPKLFTTLKGYHARDFLSDLGAGVTVGVVAIPLALAFAIASGVTPEKGIITAVTAGFLVSVLGGSRVQIAGPTGAFIVIVYGIVREHGPAGLAAATVLAGVLLMVMGFARLGTVIKFIPHSVVVGFTSGIALIIFSSQIGDFFGLAGEMPAAFLEKWPAIFRRLPASSPAAAAIGAGTVAFLAVWPGVSRRVPGSIIALVVSAFAARFLELRVETIGSRFGDFVRGWPAFHWPALDRSNVERLIRPAFAIAFLGGIESLLSAVVADGMIGARHRSNMELVAQGTANVFSGLLGGIPATGAIARTVTNIKNGGRTPVAGIVHAFVILAAVVFFGRWVKEIPLACLAGILVIVAYHMSEWRSFVSLLRSSKGGAAVLLATFFVTVFFDLTLAIEIGMVMALFVFMGRMSSLTRIHVFDREIETEPEERPRIDRIKVPDGVEIYEIDGPFFFGVAHQFEEAIRVVAKPPRVRVLRLKDVPLIDSTGLQALRSFYQKCRANRIHLIITGLHVQPLNEIVKSDLYDLIGEENVFANIKDALARAEVLKKAPL